MCVIESESLPVGTLMCRAQQKSLSMTQQYPDGKKIIAPGTVIVSAGGEVSDVRRVVRPVVVNDPASRLYYIDFSSAPLALGGSAFAQTLGRVGSDVPTVADAEAFRRAFAAVQKLVSQELLLAGHDVSAGGLVTTLLEMCFANTKGAHVVTREEEFLRHELLHRSERTAEGFGVSKP